MLAYYLQWHMRRSLAPMLFDEPDPAARDAQRTSPVAKAEPSSAAHRKAARKRTELADGEPLPVHSFHTQLGDLASSPAMSYASGAIALPLPPPPPPAHSTAPSICSASRRPRRQTDTAPTNDINGLYSKTGKVRHKALRRGTSAQRSPDSQPPLNLSRRVAASKFPIGVRAA
jgi:hypothetical protein